MHSSIKHVLQFFRYGHLPKHLQPRSQVFHDLAHELANARPESAETTVALRKLLEDKDAAIRAVLDEGNA